RIHRFLLASRSPIRPMPSLAPARLTHAPSAPSEARGDAPACHRPEDSSSPWPELTWAAVSALDRRIRALVPAEEQVGPPGLVALVLEVLDEERVDVAPRLE